MRRWQWTALVVCLAATAVVWMRAQTLRQASAPSAHMAEAASVEPAPATSQAESAADPSEDTRELARLRNEVVQLRLQKKDLATAQRENAELKLAMNQPAAIPRREPPPGFVGLEKLSNVGYTTPADAVQTFFWAMRDGNFDALVASFAPASQERKRFEQMTPEQREKLRLKLLGQDGRRNPLEQLTDVGIRAQEELSENTMAVHIGSSLTTNTVPMHLERTPEGWKLLKPGF